jgi:PAS domain S-box-containing protein
VLLTGLAVTTLVAAWLRGEQQQRAERVMDQRTAVLLSSVEAETERYRSLTEAVAAGIGTDKAFTWDDFDAVSAPLASAGLIGAASVAYVVPAETSAVAATQRLWRARGAEGLVLHPVGERREHFFSIFVRDLGRAGSPANGLDVSAAPEPRDALAGARQLGQPTVSDTYVLLRDRNLPAARQQLSFVFAAPIWTRANTSVFRGWIVLGLRSQDFLRGVLATDSQGQLDAQLLATDRDSGRAAVASYRVPGDATLTRTNSFPVADQQWTLVTRADPHRLPGAHSTLPSTVLAGGAAITVILAGLVYLLATGRARAEARVRTATAELRAAEAESRRQAGLLGAVMTSIGDGVAVVDEHGAFLLHNPAAKQLLGIDRDVNDPKSWQGYYGLYLPDGHTPFPTHELPLMRALQGEHCDGVEMVVRNPERPEGTLISVDGRPLDPSAGQRGAVAVFHDITELRRYENDLAVFAGVVAHDLKAPLAVVRGHCETAAEDLAEAEASPPVLEARASLTRIVRAVDRMAALIDTLLAFSMARDAPLRLADVDLGRLVAEVLQDRLAHLPPERLPSTYAAALPAVRADPAMLRHVVDNLIGNALKYVRAGAVARVEVDASVSGGRVRFEIRDRGIGIPDADKADVFERFHRAPAAAGYAGTGLGLAICKRIVERHGGEIGVEDNPGGGSRFFVVLAAAGSAEPAGVTTGDEENPVAKHRTSEEETIARAALERALAERANMENSRLPGLSALPAAEPSAHAEPAARLRAPVPDHQHGG